jgi:hypothetical protein
MKKIKWPIVIVTTFAFFYQFTPHVGLPDDVILVLFMISPLAVIWMAYQILKNGKPAERTFDEYFYEDFNYKRNKVK